MRFGSLFAGIGGIDLGLEWAGMECAWQVEIDGYCQKVLAKHWPDVRRYQDVRECGQDNLESVDLIAGGFPCQPHSVAGKRKGAADNRNLWPEFSRIVAELRPRYVLAENVPGIITTYIDTVLSDLDDLGYTCATFGIPAVAFDAPHRRERIFIVAYAERPEWGTSKSSGNVRDGSDARWSEKAGWTGASGQDGGARDVADSHGETKRHRHDGKGETFSRCVAPNETERKSISDSKSWNAEPNVGRVAHGISHRVDRLRGLGNAVVPQVAEWIGRRILEHAQAQRGER